MNKWVIILFAISTNTFAETKSYSLRSFLLSYLSKSKNIEIQKLTSDQLIEKKNEVNSSFFPSLSLVNSSSKTAAAFEKMSSSISGEFKNQAYIKLSQNIYAGSKNISNLKYAEGEIEKSKYESKYTEMNEVSSAIDLFYDLIKSKKIISNIEDELKTNQINLEEVKRGLQNGNAKKSQIFSIQTTIANNQVDLEEANKNFEKLMVKYNTSFQASDDDLNLFDYEIKQSHINFNIENRPDLNSLKIKSENLVQKIESTRSGNLPTVDFTSNFYILDNSKAISYKNTYSLGITVSIPFPFGSETKSQVNQAVIDHNISLYQLKNKFDELVNESKGQEIEFRSQLRKLELLTKSFEFAVENTKNLKKEYVAGLSSYTDYLQASTVMYQTKRKLEDAKIELELIKAKNLIWSGEIESIFKKI